MTWTSPKTFTANSALTAADLNTFLRDNLLQTTAAKAVNPGAMFVTSGNNSIDERLSKADYVAASESTTSNAAAGVNLTTAGPAVQVTTGTRAIVFLYCQIFWTPVTSGGAGAQAQMGYAVSGNTTIAFDTNKSVVMQHATTNRGQRVGICVVETALTPGSNTFTAKYRSASTSVHANFSDRRLAVMPF